MRWRRRIHHGQDIYIPLSLLVLEGVVGPVATSPNTSHLPQIAKLYAIYSPTPFSFLYYLWKFGNLARHDYPFSRTRFTLSRDNIRVSVGRDIIYPFGFLYFPRFTTVHDFVSQQLFSQLLAMSPCHMWALIRGADNMYNKICEEANS